jgi:hypothetical protein
MNCPACGFAHPERAKFCAECGRPAGAGRAQVREKELAGVPPCARAFGSVPLARSGSVP